MASDDGSKGLVELRPAPAVLLRHRDADLEVVTAPRTGPRVELKRGALWIRAGEDGPGVTVTHGAASVQVRAGAGVVEVSDMEALLVVASGLWPRALTGWSETTTASLALRTMPPSPWSISSSLSAASPNAAPTVEVLAA